MGKTLKTFRMWSDVVKTHAKNTLSVYMYVFVFKNMVKTSPQLLLWCDNFAEHLRCCFLFVLELLEGCMKTHSIPEWEWSASNMYLWFVHACSHTASAIHEIKVVGSLFAFNCKCFRMFIPSDAVQWVHIRSSIFSCVHTYSHVVNLFTPFSYLRVCMRLLFLHFRLTRQT